MGWVPASLKCECLQEYWARYILVRAILNPPSSPAALIMAPWAVTKSPPAKNKGKEDDGYKMLKSIWPAIVRLKRRIGTTKELEIQTTSLLTDRADEQGRRLLLIRECSNHHSVVQELRTRQGMKLSSTLRQYQEKQCTSPMVEIELNL